MNFKPLRDQLLIKMITVKESEGGIVLPDTQGKNFQLWGKVVAKGDGTTLENGEVVPIGVQVGDEVLIQTYSGRVVRLCGEDLINVAETDLMAVRAPSHDD